MSAELRGRLAVVTGSNGGLGYAIAEALAVQGCNVVLHGLEEESAVDEICRKMSAKFGIKASYFRCDLRDVASVDEMSTDIEAEFGKPDILVNNAVVRHSEPIETFGRSDWADSLAVNLSAAFHLVQWALPTMRSRHWGRIVNVSSIYALKAVRDRVGYVTTKTALLGFTRSVALEIAECENLTCNAICPGTVDTSAILERIAGIAAKQGGSVAEAQAAYLGERQPTKRFIAQEGVAALVAFLCSGAARDITGAALPVDGAWSAI
jgi:3-hydroxybutyrate dehydrogenase